MENEITLIENDARGKIRKKEEEEGGGGAGGGGDLKEHTLGICHFIENYACFVYEPTRSGR